jgi:RNA polymerase sigma factor (sigma-70 family)
MDGTAVKHQAALVVDEARLARAAAAGDRSAFAVLYGRYEQRAFNLAYRIAGSEADAADAVQQAFLEVMRREPRLGDGEPSFASHLFAATRRACHEPMYGRQRLRASEAIAEPTARFGDEGEPRDGEIREASMRLPEHQREALALRELEELSYEEIATIMETNRGAVAQLISRARINLHDELRGNVLASVAAPSPECERALPLIAARQDGQLDVASRDAAWLDAHLADCTRCRLGVEVTQEAGASYSAWAPIGVTPWLLEETMAKAAELVGADWSEEIAEAAAARGSAEPRSGALSVPAAAAAGAPGPSGARRSGGPAGPGHGGSQRHRATAAAGLAALLLLTGGVAAVVARDDPPATPVDAAADSVPVPSGTTSKSGSKAAKAGTKAGAGKNKARPRQAAAGTAAQPTGGETTATEATPAPTPTPSQTTSGGDPPNEPASRPSRPAGRTAVRPPRQTAAAKPKPTAAPTATPPPPAPAPTPTPTPSPVTEEPPPAEESPGKSSGRADPPGRPADRPPK